MIANLVCKLKRTTFRTGYSRGQDFLGEGTVQMYSRKEVPETRF